MIKKDHEVIVVHILPYCTGYSFKQLMIVLSLAVKHNPHSGNLRVLVKKCLELATNLRDESQCERFVMGMP